MVNGMLAALQIEELAKTRPSHVYNATVRDIIIIIIAGVLLTGILFLLAYWRRKKKELATSGHARFPKATENESGRSSHRRRRRHRHHRRRNHPENRPRNPTLGETGGLPPMRPD